MIDVPPPSTNQAFTLTIDWRVFTLPEASAHDVMRVVGREWTKGTAGFRGYPVSWILVDSSRGVGLLGTGSPRRLREVHVDLSAGIVSLWELSKVQTILQWIFHQHGHVTRLDCALDDCQPLVPLAVITAAAEAGQCITRADRAQVIRAFSLLKGTTSGETIYFGSPQSQTLLRIYEKRLERLAKNHSDFEAFGIRWELEFKQDRANLCAKLLVNLQQPDWKESVVGLLRSYVDFRDTMREAEEEARARALRLPWYASLTDGFTAARLTMTQEEPDEDKVKGWITRSVAPMLAALCALPNGQAWVDGAIVEGAERFKNRHRQLIKKATRKGKIPSS